MAAIRIVDLDVGGVTAGWGNAGRGYAFDLDEVEAWCNTDATSRESA